jgi:TrmH family RNA methyltransferase
MITSVKNEKVKAWKKLHQRKERKQTNTFLIEGLHLIEEAWKSDWKIKEVIVLESTVLPEWIRAFTIEEVSVNVFAYISQTRTPQGIAAVVEMKCMDNNTGNHILLVDAVQDPGNLGTMIRTADAAGFDGIVLGDGTVDLFNDKVVRATQGSIFHLPISHKKLADEIVTLKGAGFTIWATALEEAEIYSEVTVANKIALIVGNEGAGVERELIASADTIVTIPIYGKAESLNVSVASAILMYYLKS